MIATLLTHPEGGLLVGFCGALLIGCLWMLVVSSSPWHHLFHGDVARIYSCDHCSNRWLGRK